MERSEKIKAYKRLFSTDDGKAVLEDLLARYGFDENGVERIGVRPGQTHADLALIEGMKEVLRYVLRTRNANPEKAPKHDEAENLNAL